MNTMRIEVLARSRSQTRGWLRGAGLMIPVALGRSGAKARKREGDGATPIGVWRICRALYRADRIMRPRTAVPLRPIRGSDGWCDAAGDRNYNRSVRLPYPASAEAIWREDQLYDLIVVLDHNRIPRVQGGGSAIFMHCARDGLKPTEGCIAMRRDHLFRLLARVGRGTRIAIA